MKNVEKPHIEFTNLFNKHRKSAPLDVRVALREALEIFAENPNTDGLSNHSLDRLGKKYFGFWSIDVDDDWRALYRKIDNRIIFIALGTHKQLYSK